MQTRRQFLQHTASIAALAALPFPSRAADTGISLGFSLYGMKTVPLDEALRVVRGDRISQRRVDSHARFSD